MSQWDFGYGREPDEQHEPPYPQRPEPEYPETAYPYGQEPEDPGYAYPDGSQYQYSAAPPEPHYPPPPPAGRADNATWSFDTGLPGSGVPYDPPDAYPITYERDGFEGRSALPGPPPPPPPPPPPTAAPPYAPWPDAADPASRFDREPGADRWRPPPPPDRRSQYLPGRGYRGSHRPVDPPTLPGDERWPPGDEGDWDDGRPDRGRWLIPAGLAVVGAAVGAAIVMFALGHARAGGTAAPTAGAGSSAAAGTSGGTAGTSSSTAGAGPTPLTVAAARSALSAYTAANNSANARRSATTLATVETGGSFAIDAGLYTVQAADGTAPFPAFAPASATYYIPQAEPADGTRWFVVQVGNAFAADPNKVTSTEYLLFTKPASGGAWQNAVEPYLLAGADAPQVAVGGNGLATAVSATATSLAVAPGDLAGLTASAIDGTGAGVSVTDPGALADRSDQMFWRVKLPTATVTDADAAATGTAGQTFALLTTNGGALVFYTDAAELTITPPAGSVIHLTVPGLYSANQALSRAGLSYLDQFAAVDPPAGQGTPRVVAQYSGLTGKG